MTIAHLDYTPTYEEALALWRKGIYVHDCLPKGAERDEQEVEDAERS